MRRNCIKGEKKMAYTIVLGLLGFLQSVVATLFESDDKYLPCLWQLVIRRKEKCLSHYSNIFHWKWSRLIVVAVLSRPSFKCVRFAHKFETFETLFDRLTSQKQVSNATCVHRNGHKPCIFVSASQQIRSLLYEPLFARSIFGSVGIKGADLEDKFLF